MQYAPLQGPAQGAGGGNPGAQGPAGGQLPIIAAPNQQQSVVANPILNFQNQLQGQLQKNLAVGGLNGQLFEQANLADVNLLQILQQQQQQ